MMSGTKSRIHKKPLVSCWATLPVNMTQYELEEESYFLLWVKLGYVGHASHSYGLYPVCEMVSLHPVLSLNKASPRVAGVCESGWCSLEDMVHFFTLLSWRCSEFSSLMVACDIIALWVTCQLFAAPHRKLLNIHFVIILQIHKS